MYNFPYAQKPLVRARKPLDYDILSGGAFVRDFDARLIARNTGWLYLRSFAICLSDLVAARIVLQELGVDGYGLYAAVAGVVGIVAFLGGALDETFRRYFSVEMGRGHEGDAAPVFASAMGISAAFAACVLLVGETAGLAFVRCSLDVPSGSGRSAIWVYQSCLLAAVLGILSKPFVAHAVASERMHLMTVIGCLRAFLMLLIAASLVCFSSSERLFAYAMSLVGLEAIELVYWCIRSKTYASAWLHPHIGGGVLGNMLRFCFLSSFKTIACVAKYNGAEVLLNLRAGVAFNSSWSVAQRLSGMLYTLTGNFIEAFSPQLVKLWARQDRRPFFVLLTSVERYSFFIMWFFAFPVLLFAPEIGKLWLGEGVPPQFAEFVRALTVNIVFDSLGWPLHSAIIADAKRLVGYQVVSSGLMASGFLFACGALIADCPEWTVPAGVTAANALAFVYRGAYLNRSRGLAFGVFFRSVLLPVGFVVSVSAAGAAFFGRHAGLALSALSAAALIRGHAVRRA